MTEALLTAYIVAGVGMVVTTGMPEGRWRYLIAAAGVVAWPLFLGWGLYLNSAANRLDHHKEDSKHG